MSDLTKEEYAQLKKALDESVRPLFFFDDDPDGAASFLTLLRYKGEGNGVMVKSKPILSKDYLNRVVEYSPDVIFVLDMPDIEQEFIDKAKTPIYMIDHHKPIERERIKYFNPRVHGGEPEVCTSFMCYNMINREGPDWVPLIGIIGDWMYPDVAKKYSDENLDLLPKEIDRPDDALFTTQFGQLVKIVSFALKGKTSETYKALKYLKTIKDPREILEQTTKEGKFLFKKSEKLSLVYDDLFSQAENRGGKDGVVEFIYTDAYPSVTKDLSNRIYHRFPDQVVIVGRVKNGEVKMSIRARDVIIPPVLEAALVGIRGYGGGHEHACGACVHEDDYPHFIKSLKEGMQNQ